MPIDVKTFQLFIFNGCEAGRDTITLAMKAGLEARGYSCEECWGDGDLYRYVYPGPFWSDPWSGTGSDEHGLVS